MEDQPVPLTPISPSSPKKSSLTILIVAIVILLLVSIGGVFVDRYLRAKKSSVITTSQLIPTPRSKFDILPTTTNFSLPQPPYAVVMSGKIAKNQASVTFEPFFFTTTTSDYKPTPPVQTAEFTLVLKKNGQLIKQEQFSASECIDFSPGDYCGKSDPSYGDFVFAATGFSQLPDEIIVQHKGVEIYKAIEPSEPFPTLTLTNQQYANGLVKIDWQAPSTPQLHYYATISNGTQGQPILDNTVNRDGSHALTTSSFAFAPAGYIEGNVFVNVYATDGFRTYAIKSQTFTTDKNPVEAKIVQPENNKTYPQNYVQLEAQSIDPRSGLSCNGCEDEGNTFTWTSDVNGVVSTQHDTYCQFLTPGKHKLTLQVKNQNGTMAESSVNITVSTTAITDLAETKLRQQKGEACY